MLKNYLKVAYRNFLRNKEYALINIVGLAVGIACCLLIYRYISYEWSYDRFHKRADRIYHVTMQSQQSHIPLTPSMIAPTVTKLLPEVEKGVRISTGGRFIMRYKDRVFEEQSIAYVDSTFFEVFSYQFLAGDPEMALSRPHTMVLSRDMAHKYFGDENPVGKTILINNDLEFTVTGVIENIRSNTHLRFDFLASLSTRKGWSELQDHTWRAANFYTYLLLRDRADEKLVEEKIASVVSRNVPEGSFRRLHLQPITDIHLYSEVKPDFAASGDIRYVWSAIFIAILILLIACINYMNLATARSARRSREVGIRKVLGSGRSHLIRQFYGESVLVVLLALLLSVLLVELCFPWFRQLVGRPITLDLFSPRLWGFLLGMGVFVALLAGSYPALLLSSFRPASVLNGSGTTGKGNSTFRKSLVVFQFAISVFLIIGTLVVYNQVQYVQQKELGYQKENVIALRTYGPVEERFEAFKNELLREPEIRNMTMASGTPTSIGSGYQIDIKGVEEDPEKFIITGLRVYPGFIETLGMRIIAGRSFRRSDFQAVDRPFREREYAFILNETAAQTFGKRAKDLIGRRTRMHARTGTIVGVVNDFHFSSLHSQIEPLAIFVEPDYGYSKLLISMQTDNIQQTIRQTRKVWSSFFPGFPFKYIFLDQEYDALYRQEVIVGRMFISFAALAIFIACLGLFGLASYMVEQRTKEIGVRKVLGATVSNILKVFYRDFIWLAVIGYLIAVPVAFIIMNRWLHNFAYRVEIDFFILSAAGLLTFTVVLFTVSYQAFKAAVANPVNSLRRE